MRDETTITLSSATAVRFSPGDAVFLIDEYGRRTLRQVVSCTGTVLTLMPPPYYARAVRLAIAALAIVVPWLVALTGIAVHSGRLVWE